VKIPINIKTGSVDSDDQMDIIVGIDLGTTNSLVAYIKKDQPVAVKDKDGKNTLVPSVIHFDKNDNIIVGDQAKSKLISDPKRTIYSVKRLMGKSYDDLSKIVAYMGYQVIDEDKDKIVKIKVGEKFYSPIELSGEILKHLKNRIEDELKKNVTKAVITVPAYFNDTQRQATRDAGKLAGLEVLRIVNEPTAASLAYGIGLDRTSESKIAVYDLGGGTFDITILEINNGVFDVLSTNGDTFLGGDDFDQRIVEFWQNQKLFLEDSWSDKSFLQNIRLTAEEAKKVLTTKEVFSSYLLGKEISISRTDFDKIIKDLVDKTIELSKSAVKDAHIKLHEIDQIVMVGGSTRVPLVIAAVSRFFGKPVNNSLNPDEVVALGAAIQADILAGNRKDILLLDITPLSLGIETVGGLMDVIIPRNSKVPSRQARNYTTSVDGQTKLKIAVFQGERDLVENNRKLGEFILSGIPPMPAGLPKIQVQFGLDADGILTVKALEERSGKTTQIEIKSQYGISEEEMAKMLLDSIKNAKDDMVKKALIEAQTEAKNILLSTDKFIEQNKDLLISAEKKQLIQYRTSLEKAVSGSDKDAIEKIMFELNEYSRPLAKRSLDYNISKSLQGKDI
jgi:molecular chaperone HscA